MKQSDCKAAVKVVSGIGLKVCVPFNWTLSSHHFTLQGSTAKNHISHWFSKEKKIQAWSLSWVELFILKVWVVRRPEENGHYLLKWDEKDKKIVWFKLWHI